MTEQQRVNHNIYLINETEHIIKSLHELNRGEALRITHELTRCFLIDTPLEYSKALRRTYYKACQVLDNLNMD